MSESKKTPKPFLKRGTRQYLSNATVRSLNQKPRVIQYAEEQQQQAAQTNVTHHTFGKPAKEDEIKIAIKKDKRTSEYSQPPIEKRKAKQNKSNNTLQNEEPKNLSQNSTKKPSILEDYLGSGSLKKSTTSKPGTSKQKIVKNPSFPKPVATTLVGSLKRQQQVDESDDDQIISTSSIKKPIPKNLQLKPANHKVVKEQLSKVDNQQEQICFNSDQQQEKPVLKASQPKVAPKPQVKVWKNKWEQDNHQTQKNQPEPPQGPSKILQKYYKKQPVLQNIQSTVQQSNKLKISDIPQQIKQQIINEYVASKKSELQKKLDELQQQTTKARKQRQRFQDENKRILKEREQFQKQMEEKTKEFQQKLKAQNSKLTRQKRYMKDQQIAGKGDWKAKNQLQQLRSKLEIAQNQKKKLKSDWQRDSQRLKKKNEELVAQLQSFKYQIKEVEIQKLDLKARLKEIQNPAKPKTLEPRVQDYYKNAPTSSYIEQFDNEGFSLLQVDQKYFDFHQIEQYQFYQQVCDLSDDIVAEQQSEHKISRRYKSGKQYKQYIGRLIKETFPSPFNFSIIHHVNKDVKIQFKGIQIYYSALKNITEFNFGSGRRIIRNFHKYNQIEMEYKHPREGEIKQTRKNNTLVRKLRDEEQYFKIGDSGQIVQVK